MRPEPVRHEALRGEVRPAAVAPAHAGAADPDLAGLARSDRLAPLVEQMDLDVRDRPPDRGWHLRVGERRDQTGGRHHRAFAGAVIVDHRERQAGPRVAAQRLAAGQQAAQRRARGPIGRQHRLGQRRRDEGDADPLLDEPRPQQVRRRAHALVGQHHGGADAEIGPDLPDRGVEAEPREMARPVLGRDAEGVEVPGDEVQEVAVGDLDTLRRAGRPGGVDDIGEVLAPDVRGRLAGLGGAAAGVRGHDDATARPRAPRGVFDQDGRSRVVQQLADALVRPGGVERQEGAPGLHHGKERGHLVEGALQADADRDVATDAQRSQAPCESTRPRVQLAVGQAGTAGPQRHGLRAQPGDLGHKLRNHQRRLAGPVGQAPGAGTPGVETQKICGLVL